MKYKVALTNPTQHPPDSVMLDLLHHCDASLEARDCAAHSAEALSSLRLQAYEEVARALRGEPMSNVVNREFL